MYFAFIATAKSRNSRPLFFILFLINLPISSIKLICDNFCVLGLWHPNIGPMTASWCPIISLLCLCLYCTDRLGVGCTQKTFTFHNFQVKIQIGVRDMECFLFDQVGPLLLALHLVQGHYTWKFEWMFQVCVLWILFTVSKIIAVFAEVDVVASLLYIILLASIRSAHLVNLWSSKFNTVETFSCGLCTDLFYHSH